MSKSENTLAVSFIAVVGLVFWMYFYQENKISSNTDKIDFVLKMDSIYQGKGSKFMLTIYNWQDSALKNHEIMKRQHDSIIKLLNCK